MAELRALKRVAHLFQRCFQRQNGVLRRTGAIEREFLFTRINPSNLGLFGEGEIFSTASSGGPELLELAVVRGVVRVDGDGDLASSLRYANLSGKRVILFRKYEMTSDSVVLFFPAFSS